MFQLHPLKNVLQHLLPQRHFQLHPICPGLTPTLVKTIGLCHLILKINSLHLLQVPEKALPLNPNEDQLDLRQNQHVIIIRSIRERHPLPNQTHPYLLARLTKKPLRFYTIMTFPNQISRRQKALYG